MKKIVFTITATLALAPSPTHEQAAPAPPDPRIAKLQHFFDKYLCPAPMHVADYLTAADQEHLDYRLLPAISVQESTCGRHVSETNNFWGWNSGKRGFDSVPQGIQYVTRQLAQGNFYRDRPIQGKLMLYNPDPEYARQVQQFMREIDN